MRRVKIRSWTDTFLRSERWPHHGAGGNGAYVQDSTLSHYNVLSAKSFLVVVMQVDLPLHYIALHPPAWPQRPAKGTAFKHSEAFSFQITTDGQAETDRYRNAIVGNSGQEGTCGWCKDIDGACLGK